MKNILFICCIILFYNAYTQSQFVPHQANRSNTWLLGYNSDTIFSNCEISELDFLSGNAQVSLKGYDIGYYVQNASISDTLGNLLFSTNGFIIQDKNGNIMENGDSLLATVSPQYLEGYYPQGIVPYGSIILPKPNSTNFYYVIYEDIQISANYMPKHLYYSVVDMSLNNGLGKVIEKDKPLLQANLDFGFLSATRHANGRDWWLIVPEVKSNCYYVSLLSENGFSTPQKQCLGGICRTPEPGQMCFSPQGDKMIRCSPHNELNVYNFNRCNGLLSNAKYIQIRADTTINSPFLSLISQGACVSPNNQFLYVSAKGELLQFDLSVADIATTRTTVAVNDNFFDSYYAPSGTVFYVASPAIDGRIYLGTYSSYYMHIIDKPDLQGVACNVQQHALFLAGFYSGSLPTSVYYGLGRLYGSPCDTLVSYQSSMNSHQVKIYPNPAQSFLTIEMPELKSNYTCIIYNPLGQKVYETEITQLATQVFVGNWAKGAYFYEVIFQDKKEYGKVFVE